MKLPKVYEASAYESDIYALWEKSRVFVADPKSHKEHYSIMMPPPNETGTLSLGHALFLTLQDIMARHARQQGKDVLWLPGTDHAALAVNAIIEKKLTEEGTDKHAVGREVFLERLGAGHARSIGWQAAHEVIIDVVRVDKSTNGERSHQQNGDEPYKRRPTRQDIAQPIP